MRIRLKMRMEKTFACIHNNESMNQNSTYCVVQGSENDSVGQIEPRDCFNQTCELRVIFTFLKYWHKNLKKNLRHMKLYEYQFSVPINKVLLDHSQAHSFMYHRCPLSCYKGRVKQLQQRLYSLQSLKYYVYYLALFRKSLVIPVHRNLYSTTPGNRNVHLFICVCMRKQFRINETKVGLQQAFVHVPMCTYVKS